MFSQNAKISPQKDHWFSWLLTKGHIEKKLVSLGSQSKTWVGDAIVVLEVSISIIQNDWP